MYGMSALYALLYLRFSESELVTASAHTTPLISRRPAFDCLCPARVGELSLACRGVLSQRSIASPPLPSASFGYAAHMSTRAPFLRPLPSARPAA
jgi:hypothetical protein